MASWRDTASEQAQHDLDSLTDAALTTAEQELTVRGSFHPFGVVRTQGGETRLVATSPEGEHPSAEEMIGRLWEVLADERDGFRGVAVVSDQTFEGADQV